MKSYKKYDPVDFAQDASFIRWVLHHTPKDTAFWQNWLTENPEMEASVEEAKLLVLHLKFKEKEPTSDKLNNLWEKIDQGIASNPSKSRFILLRPLYLTGAAAAAILLLLITFNILKPYPVDADRIYVTTQNAETKTFLLPDQSKVQINAASEIQYQKENWSDYRTLELIGEAYFEVEKGEKFTVVTHLGNIEVLGTKFNVYYRGKKLKVACYEGSVRVSLSNKESHTLSPGKSIVFDSFSVTHGNFDQNSSQIWINKDFEFENVPYKEYFGEVERQFNVKINVSDSSMYESLYHGYFSTDSTVEAALQKACFVSGWKYSPISEDKSVFLITRN